MDESEGTEISRELRFASDTLINLYAARINSLLYPYDHPLVSDSLKNAYNSLQKIFQKKKQIRVEAADNKLLVEGKELLGDLPVFAEFASWLNSNNVRSLTFDESLTRRELISFHKVMTMRSHGGRDFAADLKEKGIVHIAVHPSGPSANGEAGVPGSPDPIKELYISTRFDNKGYQEFSRSIVAEDSRVQDTMKDLLMTTSDAREDQAIPDTALAGEPAARMMNSSSAEDCVSRLIDGEISDTEKGVIREISPDQLTHYLNAMFFVAPPEEVVERIVSVYFGKDNGKASEEAPERRRIILKGLKAEIRPAFEMQCESFFNEMADRLRAQAESARKIAAPSHEYPASDAASGAPEGDLCDIRINPKIPFDFIACKRAVFHDIELDNMTAALFAEDQMARLAENALREDFYRAPDSYGTLYVEDCSAEALLNCSFEVLLELLVTDLLPEDVCSAIRAKLASFVKVFAETGDFERILETYNALKSQTLQGKPNLQASAMIKNIFQAEEVNIKVAQAIKKYGRKNREPVARLTMALRSSLVPYLLDVLVEETKTSNRRFIMGLLVSIGGDVLPHIVRKLNDSRWYVIRNMLYLLRECSGRRYASDILEFLEHDVPLVRLEALNTLLSFQAPEADAYVLSFLRSDDLLLRKGAIGLAGAYRIRESVPYLLNILTEKDVFGKNLVYHKGVVRALGRIGDSSGIEHFLAICRSTSMLNKDKLEKLKLEIFRTLYRYPPEILEPLIDYGMESGNREIVAISEALMDRYRRSFIKQRRSHAPANR